MEFTLPGGYSASAILIQQGLDAFFAGDRARALRLMVRAIEHDPNDEHAWLGLARVVTAPDRRRYCLERALLINPHNLRTRAALRDVRGEALPAPAVAETDQSAVAPSAEMAAPAAAEASEAVQERAVGDTGTPWYTIAPELKPHNGRERHTEASSAELRPFSMDQIDDLMRQNGSAFASSTVNGAHAKPRRQIAQSAQPLILRPVTFSEDTPSAPVTVAQPVTLELVEAAPPLVSRTGAPDELAGSIQRVAQRNPGAYRFQIVGALVLVGALSLVLLVVLFIIDWIPAL